MYITTLGKISIGHYDTKPIMASTGSKTPAHKYDPNFTRNVINAIGPKATPRMRSVMSSLIQHLHDFARENEITVEEWMAGVTLVSL